ncbi:hypothetical protein EF096_11000 [Pseudomonas neustonica]|uniref:Uncharacterized protein n=2 Tax=Pseudomonas TaxID=286 RepID=A0ABX9XK32_9PSED|nr:hypothetical protein [Pseudomonadales bacterium]ROZ82432.1 hypothetical protein EF099_12180 [Pseudomonas sp. SSM44]ROZ84320.1 hypothetical protein EF096_11000 [Pseudomonas neustonica]|tara:strand:- start:662 stop:973 length:312 start_codon:yes stop_codon:yes gene_type:complete
MMKQFSALLLAGLFCLSATQVSADTAPEPEVCTPKIAIDKAGVVAQMIYDMTKNNPDKAEELRDRMNQLQEENPADSSFDACQAYQRLIDALDHDVEAAKAGA